MANQIEPLASSLSSSSSNVIYSAPITNEL